MSRNKFEDQIFKIIEEYYPNESDLIVDSSELLQYIIKKTKSSDNPKARASWGNLFAIYVLVEDYISQEKEAYLSSGGAVFSDLLKRMRELPFGSKLQNHALNHRLNQEFIKYFKDVEPPVIRDESKYWVNPVLLEPIKGKTISKIIINIIDKYIESKTSYYFSFINMCATLKKSKNREQLKELVENLLSEKSDARLFEIVSFCILKSHYLKQSIYWGDSEDAIKMERLELFKTGRTNANDGGIDFVMKPLGRFFQVTETTDLKKYFLDIDKIKKFPISFVIKSDTDDSDLIESIQLEAESMFKDKKVILSFMSCVEEVISMPKLNKYFEEMIERDDYSHFLDEIIIQSKTEFHIEE